MIELVQVKTDEDVRTVASLAETIWNEFFPAIISQAQVDYMVHKFQSLEAITSQVSEGYLYYLINLAGENIGYIGLVSQDQQESMQISKFYILKDWRGKGFAREVMKEIMVIAKGMGCSTLFLTVNRYNHSAIAVYQKIGFGHIGELITDIGQGYVMDDYVMEISIPE